MTSGGAAEMSDEARVIQRCPGCKKKLHIRTSHVGKLVSCRHCRHQFVVNDPSSSGFILSDSGLALLDRVDEMLEKQTKLKGQ
jgi:hypothetical protein